MTQQPDVQRRKNLVTIVVVLLIIVIAVPFLVHAIHGGYQQGEKAAASAPAKTP
ncbi:MAG: hypothetical protein ACREND_16010 [Gemmatimonadaceae bacterium]